MLTRPPNGRVQVLIPLYGLPAEPSPEAAAQVAPLATVACTAPMMLPELTSPLAAWTVSLRLSMVRVSSASSRMFRTVYEQTIGSPILVGLVQPLVKPMPCWTSAARATPGLIARATSIVAAIVTPNLRIDRMLGPPLCRAMCDICAGPPRSSLYVGLRV